MSRKENKYDFIGILIEEIGGKTSKSNGAVKLAEDHIFVEKRSRWSGKLEDSYEISYDLISGERVNRLTSNKLEIGLEDKNLILRTLDYEELDDFEDKLLDIVEGETVPQVTVSSKPAVAKPVVENKISEADIPDHIRKYYDLYKEGIISEEEFENKKKELLNG